MSISKRYQLVKAPHVADRLRRLGCKEIQNVNLPSTYCAVFELDRNELKLFHALCRGEEWTPVTDRAQVSTKAHGLITFSYTWSPTAIVGGVKTLSGWRAWSVLAESGLELEVPHKTWFTPRSSHYINSIESLKAAILRFHSKSRVETSEGVPTGGFHKRLGDTNYGYGVVVLPIKEYPHAVFVRNFFT